MLWFPFSFFLPRLFTNGRRGPSARSLPTTGWLEAPGGGLRQCGATADLSEDLVQVRRLSRIAEVTPRRQLQEGGRIGAHGGDREEAGPALDPAGTGSGAERRRQAGSAVPREVAEEGGGFSTEPPANFDPDNDETRPSRARKLGVFGAACDERRPGLPRQGVRRRPAAARRPA